MSDNRHQIIEVGKRPEDVGTFDREAVAAGFSAWLDRRRDQAGTVTLRPLQPVRGIRARRVVVEGRLPDMAVWRDRYAVWLDSVRCLHPQWPEHQADVDDRAQWEARPTVEPLTPHIPTRPSWVTLTRDTTTTAVGRVREAPDGDLHVHAVGEGGESVSGRVDALVADGWRFRVLVVE